MTQVFTRIGVFKSKGTVSLALAVLACWMIFPAAATACDHRAAQAGALVLPALQSIENLAPAPRAKTAIAGAARPASIVGLWHVLFVSGGQPFDEGFDQWHRDGTEILNDTAPPQPANGSGTVCLGVFKKTGPGTYKLKHPFWSFDANGNLAGKGFINQDVTLDASGDSYHGSFIFDLYDLSGNLIFEATGELTAERITPD